LGEEMKTESFDDTRYSVSVLSSAKILSVNINLINKIPCIHLVSLGLTQNFSTLATGTHWTRLFFVMRGVVRIVGCLAPSKASTYQGHCPQL